MESHITAIKKAPCEYANDSPLCLEETVPRQVGRLTLLPNIAISNIRLAERCASHFINLEQQQEKEATQLDRLPARERLLVI